MDFLSLALAHLFPDTFHGEAYQSSASRIATATQTHKEPDREGDSDTSERTLDDISSGRIYNIQQLPFSLVELFAPFVLKVTNQILNLALRFRGMD